MNTQRVTVLMPAYNAMPYLPAALDSVLWQKCKDFRLIIVDDGSTDGSVEFLRSVRDPRISVLRNERKLGLANSLNRGLALVESEYLARMDADDIILPDRLERQMSYLDRHPDIGACGTDIIPFSGTDLLKPYIYPRRHEQIAPLLLFFNSMPHASSMLRVSVLRGSGLGYRNTFHHAEDYDLWWRFTEVAKVATIAAPVYLYRQHPRRVSVRYRLQQIESEIRICRMILGDLGIEADDAELRLHRRIVLDASLPGGGFGDAEAGAALDWLAQLVRANRSRQRFHERDLFLAIAQYALRIAGPDRRRQWLFLQAISRSERVHGAKAALRYGRAVGWLTARRCGMSLRGRLTGTAVRAEADALRKVLAASDAVLRRFQVPPNAVPQCIGG
jgi:glycosyltransferase involved in cell wall biosynthesis